MRVWRRRSDGFEWHKHVRTTIRLKRADRRRRIEVARAAAVNGLRGAGRTGIEAGHSGLSLAGRWARATAAASQDGAARLIEAVPSAWAQVRVMTSIWLIAASGPIRGRGVQLLLMAFGLAATGAASIRLASGGLTVDAAFALLAGVATLLIAALPILLGEQELRLGEAGREALAHLSLRLRNISVPLSVPGWGGLHLVGLRLPGVVAASVLGGGLLLWWGASQISGGTGLAGIFGQTIEGRAAAIAGDVLRIGQTEIRLAGIEAPDPGQRCSRPGDRRWRCGAAARSALAQIVRGTAISCTLSGSDAIGRPLGTCAAKGQDIAEQLVREGHVFAETGLFSRYASHEEQARAEKVGLWRGEAERPSEYRAKVAERLASAWDEAKRTAPGGCPIKGRIASGRKYYVLPGTVDYPRIRIRTRRGERWFCSEEEALAAGWKRAPRS